MSKHVLRAVLRTLTTVSVLAAAGSALAADPTASSMANLIVVHGIPGSDVGLPQSLPVDVLVNGATCLLKGFTFGTVAGPVAVPPGVYKIAVSLADSAAPCANKPIINATVNLGGGSLSAVVAALSATNAPTAEFFRLNGFPLPPGSLRFVDVNATDAPAAMKVVYPGVLEFQEDLKVGASATVQGNAPSGDYQVTVKAPTSKTLYGPFTFTQPPQGLALLFAVGSAKTGSLTVLTQTLPLK
jgi:hypothetical protein